MIITFKKDCSYTKEQLIQILNESPTVNQAARNMGIVGTSPIRSKIVGDKDLENAYKSCQERGFFKRKNPLSK